MYSEPRGLTRVGEFNLSHSPSFAASVSRQLVPSFPLSDVNNNNNDVNDEILTAGLGFADLYGAQIYRIPIKEEMAQNSRLYGSFNAEADFTFSGDSYDEQVSMTPSPRSYLSDVDNYQDLSAPPTTPRQGQPPILASNALPRTIDASSSSSGEQTKKKRQRKDPNEPKAPRKKKGDVVNESFYDASASALVAGIFDEAACDDDKPVKKPAKKRARTSTKAKEVSAKSSQVKLEDIVPFFHLPIREAASKLELCTTLLKQLCRKLGVKRWPQRKIAALDRKVSLLQARLAKHLSEAEAAKIVREIACAQEERAQVIARSASGLALNGMDVDEDDGDDEREDDFTGCFVQQFDTPTSTASFSRATTPMDVEMDFREASFRPHEFFETSVDFVNQIQGDSDSDQVFAEYYYTA